MVVQEVTKLIEGNTIILAIEGDFDAMLYQSFKDAYSTHSVEHFDFIIDLKLCDFAGITVYRSIRELFVHCLERPGKILIRNCAKDLRKSIDKANKDNAFTYEN